MLEEGFDLSQKRSDWDIDENKGVTKATYNVIGLKPIHVTLNKTKHLVLNFHCDCTHFKTNKGCKHITGLLYIGQIKTVRLKPVNEQRKVGFEELFDVGFHIAPAFFREKRRLTKFEERVLGAF